ncbi:MAG: chemotaxis protein CheR [Phenylobacterium zucineum]|nr:MAG: chemotaxis protein CheR [Phenylobacterium zucineum]
MTPEDCGWVAGICAARVGLKVDPEKTYLIESRLGPVARRERFPSVDELVSSVRGNGDDRLEWAVIEAMAAGESSFFRDRVPFECFRNEILPTLTHVRGTSPLRVWSAGCGAGQEIYSLAMVVQDSLAELPVDTQIQLFGSDLSDRAMEKAQSGIYTHFEVQRGLPIRQLVRHFQKSDDMWVLGPHIRTMVRWRRLNLMVDQAAAGGFDVIFCRNVLCNMTPVARQKTLAGLAHALSSDGFLFLGEGESTQALGGAFHAVADRPGLYARNPGFRLAA